MVVVGHSMGCLVARLLLTDSSDHVWKTFFKTPPSRTPLQPEDRAFMEDCLIFKHRPEIARAVFICGPHRGSDLAKNWIGRIVVNFVRLPKKMQALNARVGPLVIPNPDHTFWHMPTSIETLEPGNRFVKAVDALPLTPGVPYHQIMGDRGRHDTPRSSDGIVPYWSSHLEGAQSELIVPYDHLSHTHPETIAEVGRILKLHLHAKPPRDLR